MNKSSLKNYPKLKFKINKALDKKMCFGFWVVKVSGIDFTTRGIIKIHPSLKKLYKLNVEEKINLINEYVDSYYLKYRQILTRFLKNSKLNGRL